MSGILRRNVCAALLARLKVQQIGKFLCLSVISSSFDNLPILLCYVTMAYMGWKISFLDIVVCSFKSIFCTFISVKAGFSGKYPGFTWKTVITVLCLENLSNKEKVKFSFTKSLGKKLWQCLPFATVYLVKLSLVF